jgi:hypothetical protein
MSIAPSRSEGHLVAELPNGQLLGPCVAVDHPASCVDDGDRHRRVADHLLESELGDRLGTQRGHQSPHTPVMPTPSLSGLARKFAHVSGSEGSEGSGGEGRGLGVGLGEELVEVLAGELPLERRGDLLVAPTEGE